jgi:beta-mannosidase
MALQEIALNGSDWRVLHMMPREWEWRKVWENPAAVLPSLWIPATVPGTVQDDAQEAGLIPDYTFDLNSRACEWTSERDWVYTREFETPATPADGVVRLRFEGVDWACHVYLNGQHLGDHEGMYDAFEYDITALLAAERPNRLVVVVEHAPREIGQIGRTSEVKIWIARFAYDWDWCVRLVPVGIYDSVSLLVTGPAWIADAQVTVGLNDALDAAQVKLDVSVAAKSAGALTAKITVRLDGAVVGESESPVSADAWEATLDIANPRLWWPNGYGDQPMYEAEISLLAADGTLLDSRTVPFGIRRVRAVPNDAAPEGALPYVLEVNGMRVFDKGWNWAPIQQLYGRDMPEHYRRWLGLARDANCNLLRVWGGGLLEKEVFYRLCDEFGIMVWQEFIQSSSGIDNQPSTSPEYLSYIRDQAEKMIPRRRNHPSLILWCGGNELMHDDWTPLDDTHPALAVLKDCVQRLDPGRLWLPTSASGPTANASPDNLGRMHDVHGPWQYQGPEGHYALYNTIDPLLHAEFGVEGAANLRAMRRSNTEALLWPPDETNPLWMHKGSWWIQRPMMTSVFGEIDDLETYVRASQYLQAEGLRYGLESNRRRKWHCAGTSPWQFNESWPNLSCTNVVDFYGEPRPAYWWCRRAYELLHVSAAYDRLGWQDGETFEAQVWVNNSLGGIEGATVSWAVCDLRGAVLAAGETNADLPAAGAVKVGAALWTVLAGELADSLFILRLRVCAPDGRSDANEYIFSVAEAPVYAPLLRLPQTELQVQQDCERLEIKNVGGMYAMFVRLDSADPDQWLTFDRNYLLIAPGETVTVTCKPGWKAVEISGMNFATRVTAADTCA